MTTNLVPRELDKLVTAQVGMLAQRRLARGVKLNRGEAAGLIAFVLMELIRDGTHSVATLMSHGKTLLGRRHVLPSVPHTLTSLMVEASFPTGTYLVTVHNPICSPDGNLSRALYSSFLPIPSNDLFPLDEALYAAPEAEWGQVRVVRPSDRIRLCEGRERRSVRVVSTGDRPIQVGSHYHFAEANPALRFNRVKACGFRLDVASGTSVRFEPGDARTVTLVATGGDKVVAGGNGLVPGPVGKVSDDEIVRRAVQRGFLHETQDPAGDARFVDGFSMARQAYVDMYGPSTGDLVRLGATDLWVKVEDDLTRRGDELTFGGGKTIRDGMGQMSGCAPEKCLDTVVTNALVVDWTGIYKADIGIKDGLIAGVGKAGNPDVMDGVDADLVVGSSTEVIAAEGSIVTAGGFDTHIHFICPQQAVESLCSGVTSLLGGGTGPSQGTSATTCTPGPNHISSMLRSTDDIPINIGITGKGNDSSPAALHAQIKAGACGLKLHEDWGCTPAAIDACLSAGEHHDTATLIHTDTLNESGFVEHTIASFKDRTIHTYHTEGAGGGHAPDIIRVCGLGNVLPSSTNPTRPYTRNTLDEHLDMLMICHHLSRNIPEDVAFAESRIRAETIAAEDVLHDLGAISMMSSDSQAMGRCGEVIARTWNTAHKNKVQRGRLKEDEGSDADNTRVKRYVSKYTVNPAVAQGVGHLVGGVEKGKVADLVKWATSDFGAKPTLVIKGGQIGWAQMGDPNASIPTVQPVYLRPMFGTMDPTTSYTFVSQASLLDVETDTSTTPPSSQISKPQQNSPILSYNLKKRVEAVRGCTKATKKDMKWNDYQPEMKVDPESYRVEADGVHCTAEPAERVPIAEGYYIF